jgi:HSP20 family molecular chaperone IbpA
MIYSSNLFPDMDRIFNTFFYNFPKEIKPPVSYEIHKKDERIDKIILQMAVAGYEEEDLKIWNEDNVLFIEGDNTSRAEVLGKFQNSFSWKIPTADHIDLDNVVVVFKNGLLTLNIPVKMPVKKRKYILGSKS